MPDANAYLRHAEAADALAEAARDPLDRKQLLQLAAEWRLLAAETSHPGTSPPPAGPA